MTSSADLQFDKMVVDTKLAQEYMKKNNFEFHCIGFKENGETSFDQANNKIYSGYYPSDYNASVDKRNSFQLIELANKIENNTDLFCQLEFLIRKIPIETTQRELKMIVSYLRYQDVQCDMRRAVNSYHFSFMDDCPLIVLGYVAKMKYIETSAAVNTAVVCHLFTELCHDSGLVGVKLRTLKTFSMSMLECIQRNEVLQGGCIGVVTAQCDVESAVHVFLSAPEGVVWGLRRILVQESACERFKREIAWKTRCASQADVDPQLKSFCTDLYVHEGKVFLGEYVGSDTVDRNVVLIESFRTVKELLTLIEGYQPFCVSLWSHGVAESNEIAFGITAPMVWVNRYGTVADHPQVSLAYFSHMNTTHFNWLDDNKEVRRLQHNWKKLTLSERRQKVMAVVEELPEKEVYTFYKQCIMSTQNDYGNFTHVGSNELVIGVSKPRDIYVVHDASSSDVAGHIFRLLVLGSGFVITPSTNEDFKEFLTASVQAELPIMLKHDLTAFSHAPLTQYTRVIHTGFGTIFAS